MELQIYGYFFFLSVSDIKKEFVLGEKVQTPDSMRKDPGFYSAVSSNTQLA